MKRIKYLALVALAGVWACSSDNTTAPEITGTISGTVSIEGTGANGITVTLSSGASTTTAGGGTYSFTGVPGGAYTVTISDYPSDVTFSSTSKAAAIQTAGQSVPVDFSGSYIRTASIIGSVTAGGTGIAGVSVAAAGPGGTQNKVTDANGGFNFTALRAGSYTVTISNIPANYNFTTTTQTVTVAAGATEQAQFAGTKAQDEVTASVVIQSVKLPNGNSANPAAIAGQIDVTLGIDPGSNQLSKVCVLLDGAEIPNGCQTLGAGAVAPQGPEAASTFEPTFTILTDAAADGTPSWLNGNHTLSARLDLTNATQSNVTTSMQLTFANADKLNIALTTDGKTATSSSTGKIWHSGKATATATPVLYSGGTLTQVTFQLQQADGGGTAGTTTSATDASAPFSVTWPLSGGTIGNVGAVTEAVYAIVSASALASGTAGPTSPGGVPAETAANYSNLDNVAPAEPAAWDVATAAHNEWVGGGFEFADVTPTKPADTGVGGVTCAVHVGDAGSSEADLLAEPIVTTADDVGESLTNASYDAEFDCWDALENGKANKDKSSTKATGSFGVDLTAPTSIKYTGSPADEAILAGGEAYLLTGSDALSGPGDTFGRLYMVDEDEDNVCVVPDEPDFDDCDPVSSYDWDFEVGNPPAIGYYIFEGAFRDQAGNAVDAPSRMSIFDDEDPVVGNVVLPSTLPSGGSASFSAVATDNLDLMDFTTRTIYNDGTELPYSTGKMVTGAAFGPPLIQETAMSQSVSFIQSIEWAAGGAPAGATIPATGQMFTARDWALNSSSNFNNFAAGTVAAGTSATGLNVQNWMADADDLTLCVEDGGDCLAVPDATDFMGVAGGKSGSFGAPFSRVIFYRVDGGVYTFIGETTSRSSADDGTGNDWSVPGTGREWTYSIPFTATVDDEGTIDVVAVGVDSKGDALISDVITITVNVES